MNITWNGTGAAWATHFGNSSAILEADGQRLLVDCGHTVPGRLRAMNLSLRDMDAVFISHLHGDHVYGLEEWGFRSFIQWKTRPRLLLADTLALPLWRHTLSGTMSQVCDNTCMLRDYFDVTALHEATPVAFGPWTLEIHPVHHVPNAYAYGLKVRGGGVTVAFTCDSLAGVAPWFYEDADLVFHDCSFKPYFPDTVHAHFEQLCAYPEDWRRRTYLVHYEDEVCDWQQDATWQAALRDSQMRLAYPLVPISL